MEVNTNIYGNEDMWITVNPGNWGSNVSEEEKIKIANFTDLTPQELGNNPDTRKASALGCAAYKMSQDSSWTINGDDGAFNKSVSFVGMSGNKCPYTSIKYFSNINNDQYTSNYPITQLESDTYDVVNFAFHNVDIVLRNDYGNNKRFMDIYKSAQGGNGNGNAVKDWYVRWNPDPFLGNGPSSAYPNYLNSAVSDYASSIRNQDINFVTQMPCRRVVLVPFITCTDGNDSSVGTYDLDTYLTTYKTTKPRIISVSFATYIAYDDSDAPTSSNPRQLKYFAMSLLQSSNKFSNHYVTIQGSNTRGPAENLFYPYLLMSPYIPLGGALNNGHSLNNKPSGLSTQTWSSSFDSSVWYSVMAVCDLGDMGWTNWSGDNTGETGRGEYLYCNANNLTADEIRESVREGLACFGMFFTDSVVDAQTKQLDDKGMFLGTLVEGIGYGDYTEGTANREQPQFDWKAMNENDYDPEHPIPPSPFIPDPNGYNDGMDLAQLDGFETATQRYNLYKAQAHQVFAALWSVWDPFDESDPDLNTAQIDLKTKKMFLTNNPLDCVIGLKYFPVPADMIGTGSVTPVKLGALTLHQAGSSSVEIQCKMAQNSYIHDCGSVYCAPQYQAYSGISDSWIDQYVGFELYLPFCGSVKLDTATYIGKWVNVQYHIDYITGACTAYIGIPSAVNRSVSEFMEIRSGNCAIDVPISGIQQATLEANMFNATQQLKGAALKGVSSVVGNLISTAGKVAAKDIGGAVSAGFSTVGSIAGSVNEIQSAKFELQHTQLPARMIGSASALSGAEGYLSPMLIVTEPRLIEVPDNYGHTVGFACMKYGKLKDISSGYTEINSIDLDGIACTAEEKSIIRSVLAGGIYL